MKHEVTRVITAQITCIENVDDIDNMMDNKAVAVQMKKMLDADDVQVHNIQDFIMDEGGDTE